MPPGVERLSSDGRFFGLANMPDGRVFNWFVEGKNEDDAAAIQNPDIPQKAFGRFSSDGGRTWSKPFLLFEFRARRARARPAFASATATASCTCSAWTTSPSTGRPAIPRSPLRPVPRHVPRLGQDLVSRPAGRLQAYLYRRDQLGHPASHGANPGPVELLFLPHHRKFISTCVYSDDGGKTWRRARTTLPSIPATATSSPARASRCAWSSRTAGSG